MDCPWLAATSRAAARNFLPVESSGSACCVAVTTFRLSDYAAGFAARRHGGAFAALPPTLASCRRGSFKLASRAFARFATRG